MQVIISSSNNKRKVEINWFFIELVKNPDCVMLHHVGFPQSRPRSIPKMKYLRLYAESIKAFTVQASSYFPVTTQ